MLLLFILHNNKTVELDIEY